MTEITTLDESRLSDIVEPDDTIFTPNDHLVNLILALVSDTVEKNPQAPLVDVVYLTTKSTLMHPSIRRETVSVIPAIFTYYLEVYKRKVCENATGVVNPTEIYNDAALGLFDQYLRNTNDHVARRLLVMAVKSLHEIVTTALVEVPDINMSDAINRAANIALISETIKFYSTSRRRMVNRGYITWVKLFFIQALTQPDLEFISTDEDIKRIIPQLVNSERVIKLA